MALSASTCRDGRALNTLTSLEWGGLTALLPPRQRHDSNPAFLKMDREDAFWAAKQVTAFTDADIRVLLKPDNRAISCAAEWISNLLIKRREEYCQKGLVLQVPPLDNFAIVDGKLTFEDLGARYDFAKGREYSVRWATSDDAGRLTPSPGGRQKHRPCKAAALTRRPSSNAHTGRARGPAIKV